jgi:hypothetical protein
MIKKVVISIFAILFAYIAFSQENTTIGKPQSNENELEIDLNEVGVEKMRKYQKILVVPFEPKMYFSEADQEISGRTKLTHQQIKNNFRLGLNNEVWVSANGYSPAISMLVDNPDMVKDLSYLYKSINYQYIFVPEEKAKETENKNGKSSNDNTARPQSGRIQNGQVVTEDIVKERYMNTQVFNRQALTTLAKKYEAGYFIFLNQFEIVLAPGTGQAEMERGVYRREIKVHYTILDQYGVQIYGGISRIFLPNQINDMNLLIKNFFPRIANEITSKLPQAEKTIELKKLERENKKKSDNQRENFLKVD